MTWLLAASIGFCHISKILLSSLYVHAHVLPILPFLRLFLLFVPRHDYVTVIGVLTFFAFLIVILIIPPRRFFDSFRLLHLLFEVLLLVVSGP